MVNVGLECCNLLDCESNDMLVPNNYKGVYMDKSKKFTFDGGAGTYLGTVILASAITIFTFGIFYPYALVLMQRWKAKHTYLDGVGLEFRGTAVGLFGHWIKWFLLCVITLGIYGLWVAPKLQKWIVENTGFAESKES